MYAINPEFYAQEKDHSEIGEGVNFHIDNEKIYCKKHTL